MQKRKHDPELTKKQKSLNSTLHDLILTKNIPTLVSQARHIKNEQLKLQNENLLLENERLKNIIKLKTTTKLHTQIDFYCQYYNEKKKYIQNILANNHKSFDDIYDLIVELNNEIEKRNEEIRKLKKVDVPEINTCSAFNKELENANNKLVAQLLKEKAMHKEEIEKLMKHQSFVVNEQNVIMEMYKKLLIEKDNQINKYKRSENKSDEKENKSEENRGWQQNKTGWENVSQSTENTKKENTQWHADSNGAENKQWHKSYEQNRNIEKENSPYNNVLDQKIEDCKQTHKIQHNSVCICDSDFLKAEKLLLEINDLRILYEERKQAALFHKRNSIKSAISMHKKDDTTIEDLNVDIKNLRALLRCTACDKNFKDTVLLRCCHVFCKECVDEKIRTRNRKCMNCNENFLVADVKRIFL